MTRLDLGFAVTFLSRYLHNPGEKYLQASKHALTISERSSQSWNYIHEKFDKTSTRDQYLNVLYGPSFSGFAGCKDTSRSTTGYMILMNGGVVAYYSGTQSTVALCTAMEETNPLAKILVKINHKMREQSYLICNAARSRRP